MLKVERTETEDGKFRFEVNRGRTLLVVVLGANYGRCSVRIRNENEDRMMFYTDFCLETLSNLDKTNYLVLPKVKLYEDDPENANEIEVYEFYA